MAETAQYDEAIEIAEGIYWIGFHDTASDFRCNPYLLLDGDEAVLVDPGSVPHFPVVAAKLISVLPPQRISTIILQHQDPDLCGAVPVLEDIIGRDDLRIVGHSHALMFIAYYGVKAKFYPVDENHFRVALRSGRTLTFIPVHYLHTLGTIMTYDPKCRVLFSGDLFGSFSRDWELYAGPDYEEEMRSFHAAYMPPGDLLRCAMERTEPLDIALIAPQHGSVIRKEKVGAAIQFLKNLECGAYAHEGE